MSVGASGSKTTFKILRGGAGMPPLVTRNIRSNASKFFWGDFASFRGLLN
jgi:hypothetical protein